MDSKPEPRDRLERRLIQHKIELEALKDESDDASPSVARGSRRPLPNWSGNTRPRGGLDRREASVSDAQQWKESLDAARLEFEAARRAGDLATMAELQNGRIPALEKRLADAAASDGRDNMLLRNRVTEAEVAEIVSKWTGVPVTKLLGGERDKLLKLESALHARVVGQDEP